ncbi:MAG: hypothetical protein JKY53_00150 [Flavobacteriales bacterium]|nr:hypothetical protein [Flavobacteriales bacterium]
MPWGAAAIAGAAIVGGVVQSNAASDAADAQVDASFLQVQEAEDARNQLVEILDPFVNIGVDAGEQIQNLLADPTQDLERINPVVSFLRDQGFEAIQESAAAGGRLGAGGTLQDLTQFNTELASTVVPQLQNQRFNQLFNLLTVGESAAARTGTGLLQSSETVGNLLGNVGNIRAQESFNQSNAITGGISNAAAAFGAFNQPSTTTTQPSDPAAFQAGQNVFDL